jgi:hypothetical protein
MSCLFLFLISGAIAADTIRVDPGVGTLQSAINQYGGDVIYHLQAGELYRLDGILTVIPQILGGSGKTLRIVGEETGGMPAIIQVGRTRQGTPETSMFTCSSNLSLKNLFLTDKDESGNFGQHVITLNAPVRISMDQCVIDPAGTKRTFNGGGAANGSSLYLTNSQIYRNGSTSTPNDGGWLGAMSWDTLWVENNTLVSSGQDFIGGSFHREPNNQFIWINHNTILWHDVWIKKSFNDQNFYFTNNLLHDQSLFPELPRWYPFFPDFDTGNNLLCQVAIDTLEVGGVPESLPSERRMFWTYNLMYNSPELQKVPRYAAENEIELTYLLPMLWDEDVPLSYSGGVEVASPADSCRENRILADQTNWPHMKYSNNWYDLDPLYTDSMIYSVSDSAGQHILGFYRGQFWGEADAPAVEDLPSYNWDIDSYKGHEPSELPQEWPRFDGSYANPELLSASLEGLPLGDLNWHPEAKFLWFANREGIHSHVLDLNEERFQLTDPDSISYEVMFTVVREDQTPLMDAVLVVEGDTIGVSDSYGMIKLDTLAGSYGYSCSANAYEEVHGSFTIAYASLNKSITLRYAVGMDPNPPAGTDITMYPNPSQNILYVEGENLAGALIQVINLNGSIVMEKRLPSDKSALNLRDVRDGLYLVRIAMDQKQINRRITIQH